jgi:serine/threonine-protein kinase HipA
VVGKRAYQLDIDELKFAIALRSQKAHRKIIQIQPRHFRTLADQYPHAQAWPAMIELVSRVEGAIEAAAKQMPERFAESEWTSISKGCSSRRSCSSVSLSREGIKT